MGNHDEGLLQLRKHETLVVFSEMPVGVARGYVAHKDSGIDGQGASSDGVPGYTTKR